MKISFEELSPEEQELHSQRGILRSRLRAENKAQGDSGAVHCTFCRCELSKTRTRLCHVVPLGMGGQTVAENVVLACPPCLSCRNGQDLLSWQTRLETMLAEVARLLTYHPAPMPAPETEKTASEDAA